MIGGVASLLVLCLVVWGTGGMIVLVVGVMMAALHRIMVFIIVKGRRAVIVVIAPPADRSPILWPSPFSGSRPAPRSRTCFAAQPSRARVRICSPPVGEVARKSPA